MQFDQYQQEIINAKEKFIIVIAGAGTGKTALIKGKIENLIINNINPNEICVLSYTKKAVNELKERINNQNVNICTIHSLAYHICKQENDFTIINENYLKTIIEQFLKTQKKYQKIPYLKDIIYKIIITNKKIKQKLTKKEEKIINITNQIKTIYQEKKQKYNFMDYQDLLIKATKIIKNSKHILKIKYLLIDEYQDISDLKYELIKTIQISTNSSLLVVGDDAQSIYSFNGSNLNNFYKFQTDFINAKAYYLKKTYRFSQQLTDITSQIIKKNNNQLKKDLIADKYLKKPIVIKSYFLNKTKQLEKIIKKINPSKQILILGRYNFDINFINKTKSFKFNKTTNKIIYQKKPIYNITYLTIHSSKGLGFDEVIIINNENTKYGFPTKIKENKIFKSDYQKIIEEERRLFYVALTRTKNHTYLLVNNLKKSIFIKELKKIVKNMQK